MWAIFIAHACAVLRLAPNEGVGVNKGPLHEIQLAEVSLSEGWISEAIAVVGYLPKSEQHWL